jgi:multidrug efflux system membrane fusion protein
MTRFFGGTIRGRGAERAPRGATMPIPTRFLISPVFLLALLAGCSSRSAPPAATATPIPVTADGVVEKTMPVQIRAIGNAEASASVAIKARVDGQLVRVHFREGQDVAAGQLLFQIDPRPYEAQLQQAEAALARDRATLDYARTQEQRYQELLQQHFISQEMYAQVRTNRGTAEANVHADEAAVQNARLQLEYASIRSPIAGRTGKVLIQQGNLVKANDTNPLVVINAIRPIYVSFAVPEQYLEAIRARASGGRLRVIAGPPSSEQAPAQGLLDFVDNAVDPATGTVRLRAAFPNQDHRLWPGQFLQVQLTLREQSQALVVPAQAVQVGPRGQFVFVIRPDETVEVRDVTVDRTEGAETVIAKGVAVGERVVTEGQSRLTPGAKVQVRTAP